MNALQARAANITVQNVASVLATQGIDIPVGGPAALEAANTVYGATATSLAAVSGERQRR